MKYLGREFHKLACRVCGNIQDEPPWGEDGRNPTYGVCDCCGVEFGYGDCSLEAIRVSRQRWLVGGNNWKYPKEKPHNWSLEKQLDQIPKEYR